MLNRPDHNDGLHELEVPSIESLVADLRSSREVVRGDVHGFRVTDELISESNNLIAIGRENVEIHEVLKTLASFGFLHCEAGTGYSRFVHESVVADSWEDVQNSRVKISSEGVIYALHVDPLEPIRRLLVLFAGIPGDWNKPSLWRYFNYDYYGIAKYVTRDTAVLRIGDLGGVSGAYYSPLTSNPNNMSNVSALIARMIEKYEVAEDRVCLFGPSKGATGAVLHGMRLGLSFVAVDPIVSDDYLSAKNGDSFFVGAPVFPESKQQLFRRMLSVYGSSAGRPSAVFTSPVSEHYSNIMSYFTQLSRPLLIAETADVNVHHHPQVAAAVFGPTIASVNSILHSWAIPDGTTRLS